MKRYHFTIWNDDRIIGQKTVVANSLQSAREKIAHHILIQFAGVSSFAKAELESVSSFKF